MPDTDTNQMSISLGAQLFLTHFIAAGTGVMVFTIMGPSDWLGKTAVSLTVAGIIGFLLNANIQRTLRLVDWTIRRMGEALPVDAIPAGRHGPLVGFVAHVQQVVAQERPLTDIQERALQQASELAAQEERQRLARDLHDSIKQQLFSIQVSAAAAQARWESDGDGAKTAVSDIRRSAKAALVEVNALLQQLAQHPLETVGLAQALRDQADALAYRTGAQVDVTIPPLPDGEQFPPANRETLFRIAQEAMGNIARHARADQVTITLQPDEHNIGLRITDNGQGFDAQKVQNGMGLTNMRQRAAAANGKLTIDAHPGKGTTIQLTLPLLEQIAVKEHKMQKPNHTINRVGLTGLLGGVLTAAALYYPLYVLLPGRYLAEWRTGSPELGVIFILLALLVVMGTGYTAVTQSARTGHKQAWWGAIAGGVAGAAAFTIVGGAAMTILGNGDILWHGLVPSASEDAFMLLLVNATTGVMWWIYLGLWTASGGGVLLGWLGGWMASRRVVVQRPSHQLPLLPVTGTILFAAAISSMLSAFITTALTAMLGPQVANAAADLNYTPGSLTLVRMGSITFSELGAVGRGEAFGVNYPPMIASFAPIVTACLLLIAVLMGLYAALRLLGQSADKNDQRHGLVLAYLAAWLSGVSIVGLLFVVEAGALRSMMMGMTAVIWIMALLKMRLARQIEQTFAPQSGTMPSNLRWLRNTPLFVIALLFPLALLGQLSVAFWLVVITAVLVALFVPRDWQGTTWIGQLNHFISASVGDGLALLLPLLVPLSSALGLILLTVYAIPRITTEPDPGNVLTRSMADLLLRQQIDNLYLYNGYAFLLQILFVLVLLGIVAVVYRIGASRRKG